MKYINIALVLTLILGCDELEHQASSPQHKYAASLGVSASGVSAVKPLTRQQRVARQTLKRAQQLPERVQRERTIERRKEMIWTRILSDASTRGVSVDPRLVEAEWARLQDRFGGPERFDDHLKRVNKTRREARREVERRLIKAALLRQVARERLGSYDPSAHPVSALSHRPMTEREQLKLLKRQYLGEIYAEVNAQLREQGVSPKSARVKVKPVSTDRVILPLDDQARARRLAELQRDRQRDLQRRAEEAEEAEEKP